MPLLNMPDEVLMMIGEAPLSEKDIYCLSRANSRLYSIVLPLLYKHNVQQSWGSSFPWCINHGNEYGVCLLLRWGLTLGHRKTHLPTRSHSTDDSASLANSAVRWCVGQDFGGPLHMPLQPETIRLLVIHGANVNELSDSEKTPLHEAVQFCYLLVVQLLLDLGADINAAGHEPHRLFDFQSTPLHCALRNKLHSRYVDIVKLLIKRGADLTKTDERRDTPLHAVAGHFPAEPSIFRKDASATVQLHGKEMNKIQVSRAQKLSNEEAPEGRENPDEIYASIETPVVICNHHRYMSNMLLDTAKLLIRCGAAINMQNIYGLTPLHMALRQGHLLIARLLLEHGADARVQDGQGRSASDLLVDNGHST